MFIRKIIFIGLIVGLSVVFVNGVGWTKAKKAKEVKQDKIGLLPVETVSKQKSGLLIHFHPRGDPNQITISVDKENMDHNFKIDGNTQIVGKKNLKQFTIGDRVSVVYNENTYSKKDGKQKKERVATQIIFKGPAITGLRSGE